MLSLVPDCPHGACGLFQVSASGGDVPGAHRADSGLVVHVAGIKMVAGSPGSGDGLGEQRLGVSKVDQGLPHQVLREAEAEQDIIAELPGELDRLPAGRKSSLTVVGRDVDIAASDE
jgi:hypothetical protein